MLIGSHTLDVDSGNEQVYNAMDCCLTYEIFTKLTPQIPSAQPAYDFELALQAPVLEMMVRGFRVNPMALELKLREIRAKLARLTEVINLVADAIWGKPLNPDSPTQLKELFYGYLAVPEITTYVKGELKTPMDRNVIEQISDYFQARFIATAVLAYRDYAKQLQVLETEIDQDWRMRTSYNIGGTISARFSSSKSPTGTGTNLQNIAEHLRDILIPDPGYALVGIDAEQSDSRFVGFMCGVLFNDWGYLDACESNDLHTAVARLTWPNFPWTGDIKKDRKIANGIFYRWFSYRDACKRLGHATNFLGKPVTLAKLIHIPLNLVEDFNERYFSVFPALQKWHAWTASELQRSRQLTSVHGRRRDFFDRTNLDETLRKGLAFLAAAPTADNLNLGMWRVWKHMPEVQLLAQVHDAIYFQFPLDLDPRDVIPRAQALLTTTLRAPNGRLFTVPTDPKIGFNWGNKSDSNPKGLDKFVGQRLN